MLKGLSVLEPKKKLKVINNTAGICTETHMRYDHCQGTIVITGQWIGTTTEDTFLDKYRECEWEVQFQKTGYFVKGLVEPPAEGPLIPELLIKPVRCPGYILDTPEE